MSQLPVKVAVDACYPLERAALEALVQRLPGLQVVSLDAKPPPNVLVWDVDPENLAAIPELTPATQVLLLISDEGRVDIPVGVTGLFSRYETPEALGVAIRQVAHGEQYFSPSLALALLRRGQKVQLLPALPDLSTLTDREREILTLLAKGLSNKAIASQLYLSVRTVEGHLASLYARLDVHSRTEAALIAVQGGLSSKIR